MARWLQLVIVCSTVFAVTACGSDTVKKGGDGAGSEDCPAGQRWNPILEQCEDIPDFNNATNGGGTNNDGGANNSGGANNGGGDTNNGDGDTNNGAGESNNGTTVPLECGIGSLRGKTCAPSGEPLAAADVTITGVDCDGNPFELTTRTSGDGTFSFDQVPSGQHEMTVSTGSFESSRDVFIQKDLETDLTSAAEKVCLDQNVEIAVITGQYDHVEGILDALHLEYDIKGDDTFGGADASIQFLRDTAAMGMYDLVFINCGDIEAQISARELFDPNIRTALANSLRAFVAGGGSIYVADWSHPLLEAAFPDMIDFVGDDANINQARSGYAPQTITADVPNMDLQSLLGAPTASIEFPHDPNNGVINNNWVMAETIGANSVTHISGDAQSCGAFGSGTCSSATSTLPDTPLLVTHKDPSGGTVVFTSFHNEHQTTLNQDMERILRYLIFQL